jgi:hypothetical protein
MLPARRKRFVSLCGVGTIWQGDALGGTRFVVRRNPRPSA